MGTRSITVIRNKDGKKIIEMYKHYDGYPDGLGKDLVEFTQSGKIVDGYKMSTEIQFNGIECFAAQLIANIKDGAGDVYLYPITGEHDSPKFFADAYDAEYYYEIDAQLNVRCWETYSGEEIIL